jgi:hypothetical protein
MPGGLTPTASIREPDHDRDAGESVGPALGTTRCGSPLPVIARPSGRSFRCLRCATPEPRRGNSPSRLVCASVKRQTSRIRYSPEAEIWREGRGRRRVRARPGAARLRAIGTIDGRPRLRPSRRQRGRSAVRVLTGGFMITAVVGGVLARWLALIADAGHMLTAAAALALAWAAFQVGRWPRDARRTCGYLRFQVLGTFRQRPHADRDRRLNRDRGHTPPVGSAGRTS